MSSALRFLIAAKQCEIAELERLALTSVLVNTLGQLVHGLQRERGLSSLHLASQGARWDAERVEQIRRCEAIQATVREGFEQLNTESRPGGGHGARLFSRIAHVLQGLDALSGLRERIRTRATDNAQATSAYIRLISGLLAVVFEAADSAADPEMSRRLVALFNLMQGKEFAGQERAAGASLLAAGRAEPALQQHLLHLIDAQERCLQVFAHFASDTVLASWHTCRRPEHQLDQERLRRMLCTASAEAPLEPALSQVWFDGCSAGIDAMRDVEAQMSAELKALCQQRIALHEAELAGFLRLLNNPQPQAPDVGEPPPRHPSASSHDNGLATELAGAGQRYGPGLELSILELVQEQAQRLQRMSDELDTVRASLNERKLIERAKGLLMAHRGLTEESAHKTMRQMAMNQKRRLVDVAEAVLAMADVLPDPQR